MKRPRVSIVMPAYNAGRYIETSIEAILAQTMSNFELIIVDDLSTDNTWEIIYSLAKFDERIITLKEERNSGSAKLPREHAVEIATSPFICWIDADDIIDVDYLERLLERQLACNADIVCSQMVAFCDEEPCRYTLPKKGFDFNQILNGKDAVMLTIGNSWNLNANGWLVKKELWVKTSTFLDSHVLHMNADDFSTREMLIMSNVVAFEKTYYRYRIHTSAITKNVSKKLFEPLITDIMVIELFVKTFGQRSFNVKAAYSQMAIDVINLTRRYIILKREIKDDQESEILKLLLNSRKYCRKRGILDLDISYKQKLFMLLPFSIFYKIIEFLNR